MNILAIIPARGGSKSIPKKNLAKINGLSLIEHSINHAKESKLINRIIVSTENDEIKQTAQKAGAEVPFLRPEALAEDHVLDWPVFEHVLNKLKEMEGYVPDYVVHLRPTSPYRKPGSIDEAIKILINHSDADSIRSVSKPASHPYRVFKIDEKGFLDPLMKHEHPEPYLLRRQDWPDMYFYNCVIDVTRPKTILDLKSMTGKKILPYIMDVDDVIDVDSPADLEYAKYIMEVMKKS